MTQDRGIHKTFSLPVIILLCSNCFVNRKKRDRLWCSFTEGIMLQFKNEWWMNGLCGGGVCKMRQEGKDGHWKVLTCAAGSHWWKSSVFLQGWGTGHIGENWREEAERKAGARAWWTVDCATDILRIKRSHWSTIKKERKLLEGQGLSLRQKISSFLSWHLSELLIRSRYSVNFD